MLKEAGATRGEMSGQGLRMEVLTDDHVALTGGGGGNFRRTVS